jgi:hypothetical protein
MAGILKSMTSSCARKHVLRLNEAADAVLALVATVTVHKYTDSEKSVGPA